MPGLYKKFFILIILLAIAQAGLFYVVSKHKADTGFSMPKIVWPPIKKNPSTDMVYGGILPHHLMVAGQISQFLGNIKDEDYETIVLIGPNHFNRGPDLALTGTSDWKTDYGILETDSELISNLTGAGQLSRADDIVKEEFSISNLAPFIKKYFPKAKLVPIILKSDYQETKGEELAKAINSAVDPDHTLVLASVDFSHYQPAWVAELHDLKSRTDIANFNLDEIKNLEIDSPPSISTLLNYMQHIGVNRTELVNQTNSGFLTGNFDEPTTSHNYFYFRKGPSSANKNVSMLFFGDMMLDRHVGEKIRAKGIDSLMSGLAGEENRFFSGLDVISANLEGATTDKGGHYPPVEANDFAFAPETVGSLKNYHFTFFNIANNHLSDQGSRGVNETGKNLSALGFDYSGCPDAVVGECSAKIIHKENLAIGMVGLSMVYRDFNLYKARELISELKKKTDLIVVNIHWGKEYEHKFSARQREVAHVLIDAGADIIIGHHPHVVQGIEVYKNKPIFYSLGNFIFDQYFDSDTQKGLAVGIDFAQKENEVKMYLYPFKSEQSRPQLIKDPEKTVFLNQLADWSSVDDALKTQIKKGYINLK